MKTNKRFVSIERTDTCLGSLSPQGLHFIENNEGGFKSKIYPDIAGKPTIGYGRLVKSGDQSQFAGGITEQQGAELLRSDVRTAQLAVRSLVVAPLNQYQYDSLIDFTFNEGAGAFKGSTLLTKLNRWDYNGAAAEFPNWVYAKVHGVDTVIPGLVTRRKNDQILFKGEVELFKSELGIDPY